MMNSLDLQLAIFLIIAVTLYQWYDIWQRRVLTQWQRDMWRKDAKRAKQQIDDLQRHRDQELARYRSELTSVLDKNLNEVKKSLFVNGISWRRK